MIGNDIVDLKQAAIDSNWRRRRYLQKVFTDEERTLIIQADRPEIMVWLFWSMKEAAYKIFSRELGIRNYAPARISCTIKSGLHHGNIRLFSRHMATASGQVTYEGGIYLTSSHINIKDGYIHTLSATRYEILERSTIEIDSSDQRSYKHRNPASVSHHGRYLALAFA